MDTTLFEPEKLVESVVWWLCRAVRVLGFCISLFLVPGAALVRMGRIDGSVALWVVLATHAADLCFPLLIVDLFDWRLSEIFSTQNTEKTPPVRHRQK